MRRSGQTIFLLGAGASMDAGMPCVAQLTAELARRLRYLRDINGNKRPEFQQLFKAVANYDPEVKTNYERFFEWLSLLINTQKTPFKKALPAKVSPELIDAAHHLAFVVNQPICGVFSSQRKSSQGKLCYLSRLKDFIPNGGRLKVFTLNYDLTVEDACRAAKISFTTGFKRDWHPSLFQDSDYAVNLYKLHGSLNWFKKQELEPARLIEMNPDDCEQLPELVLGPGTKLQYDDPFVTLYSEFHRAVRRARACVVVGCSLRDDHIKGPLRAGSKQGMKVVDVRPGNDRETCFKHYKRISLGAKEALENGAIREVLGT